MKKTLMALCLLLLTAATSVTFYSCKKKKDDNNSSSGDVQALSIQTGAKTINPDEKMNYTAVFVDSKGNTTPATNVTWSVSNNLGTFSGGQFTPSGSGYGTITASATSNGKTFTSQVSIGVYLPAAFAVVPSAVVWTTGAGNIPLTPVYIGTESVSGYSYSSSDPSVASVEANGSITFNKTGECLITVTANGLSGNNKVYVPVLVVGMPSATLPVVRVAVNPTGQDMFRGDNVTFTAKAYNSSNAETSATFTWASQDPSIATVDGNGKVTAIALGKTIITATASGITGQAEVDVLPDSTIIVTPFMASISAGGTKQFTANAYAVNKTNKSLTAIPMPAGLTWEIPTTGMAMFDIATVNSTGLVTMKSSATLGLSTVVLAHVSSPTIEAGAALIMVSDCDCGTTATGVTHISVTSGTTMNLSIMSNPTATITAQALDASNNPVSGATIKYCCDNMAVCTVDASTGTVTAVGPGTATITVCNGGVQTTVTVNVAL